MARSPVVRRSSALMLRNSTLTLLRAPATEIYLMGTAHVSAKSEAGVRDLIRTVKPSAVMVELCAPRAAALRTRTPTLAFPKFENPMYARMADLVTKFVFASGGEMLAAMEEAEALRARVVYGDLTQAETMMGLKKAAAGFSGIGAMAAMSRLAQAPPAPASLMRLMAKARGQLAGEAGADGGLEALVDELKDRKTLREMRTWIAAVAPEVLPKSSNLQERKVAEANVLLWGSTSKLTP